MDDFVEMDELQRLKNEIENARIELRHLLFLRSSGEDVADNDIEDKRKKIFELRAKLLIAQEMMGEEYDRYKNNKRK